MTAIKAPKISSQRRSRAISGVLKRESRRTASRRALSRQTKAVARRRGPDDLRASARKAVRTKGPEGLSEAAETRQRE